MFNREFGINNILCMQFKYTHLSSGLDFVVESGYMVVTWKNMLIFETKIQSVN